MSPFILALLGMLVASPQTTCFVAPHFRFSTPDHKAHVEPAVICPLAFPGAGAPAGKKTDAPQSGGANL